MKRNTCFLRIGETSGSLTFFIMPVFLFEKVVYLLNFDSMNSILILTRPFVFLPFGGGTFFSGTWFVVSLITSHFRFKSFLHSEPFRFGVMQSFMLQCPFDSTDVQFDSRVRLLSCSSPKSRSCSEEDESLESVNTVFIMML